MNFSITASSSKSLSNSWWEIHCSHRMDVGKTSISRKDKVNYDIFSSFLFNWKIFIAACNISSSSSCTSCNLHGNFSFWLLPFLHTLLVFFSFFFKLSFFRYLQDFSLVCLHCHYTDHSRHPLLQYHEQAPPSSPDYHIFFNQIFFRIHVVNA